ncbi:sigma-70 family RNA polymerase sigma factor [Silvibacterium dinghuense]|uniref:Sigma-70 family RNA polymerase sigma factor n=1 Tax=Silvibacterium dinghuense TaxID=1560006 RepID=A0A4Q1SIZ5_9BACT|nr:sigma-70 family RNA polymerase sigma factor [Silvibacterium dinghuense]
MSSAAILSWDIQGFGLRRPRPRTASPVAQPPRQAFESHPQPARPAHEPARPRTLDRGGADRAVEADWQIVVQRCLDGDSGAWAELVRFHHRRIYSLCFRFTGSAQDAEDLTQDVFIKVYGNLASFDLARGSFQTWITTLARNLLVDHFRRTKNQRVTDSMDAGWEESEELPLAGRLAAAGPTQHDRAAQKEIARMVQDALTKISPELREAVILRDLQDMDYKEIAQVLRIPEGTVKSRISRGRAELARLLERNKGQVV